jgi:3-dehydroquinate dehydratase-2
MLQISIINGPNLNLLGRREPAIYGSESFEKYLMDLEKLFPEVGIHYYQTNHEGAIIDLLHDLGFRHDGIILNAGAYTHTSIAIMDAISAISTPVVEVHISDIYSREPFRHTNYISKVAKQSIIGKGLDGYRLAIEFFVS